MTPTKVPISQRVFSSGALPVNIPQKRPNSASPLRPSSYGRNHRFMGKL